ncbi:MAG: M28 family peptidase [Pseudomonadota bacterium]
MANSSAAKLVGLTLLLAMAYVFRGVLAQPPAVDPNSAFQTDRAFSTLERILGDETPHPVDSDANDDVRDRLIFEIEALGFTPIVQDDFHCRSFRSQARCMRIQNIGFWVTDPGPNAVMVASHYDSVPAGPGASDDGAGFASSLEIATVLKGREFARPLFVLITDGEEAGLMGASLFASEDPIANLIGAVVNMEARGVRGLSSLIQTSHPNERDIAALISETRLPISNSLNTDIYELLPNDTDMTEFLSLPIDAANLAYAGGISFYHTPGDNLANMDKRALFNLGANALAITEAFLNDTSNEPEAKLIYADLMGTLLLVLPVWLGGAFLSLGVAIPIVLLVLGNLRSTIARGAIAPALGIILGLLLTTGLTLLVGTIRAEKVFGTAYPIALRTLHGSAMILSCLVSYAVIARGVPKSALYAGAWLWFSAFGSLAFFFVQGSASNFAFTSLFFALAAGLFLLGWQKVGEIIAGLGVLIFVAITFPTTALGEIGLLIEASAPFAFVLGAALISILPTIWPEDGISAGERRIVISVPGLLVAVSLAASILVPAYTEDAPRGLNIFHIQTDDEQEPVWSISAREPLPASFADAAEFRRGSPPGSAATYYLAPAPRLDTFVAAALIGDETNDETRELILQVSAPDADMTILRWTSDEAPLEARLNGEIIDLDGIELSSARCFGRTCQGITLELSLPAGTTVQGAEINSYTYGLPESGDFLVRARPDWTLPIQSGDAQLIISRIEIDGFETEDK